MQRLLKISFDQALLSLTPILSWFCLSLLVDKNLITVFTITYPLQCIYGCIRSPFAVGANISKLRDKNKNSTMSGMVIGILLTLLTYGFVLANLDSYLNFMNVDSSTYRLFSAYAIIILILQTIFSFVLEKLYYENQNNRANRYSVLFNLLNFTLLISTAIFTKDQATIVTITTTIMSLFTVIIVAKNCNHFRFRFNFLNCFKYDLADFTSYISSFFIFLFGLSNALEFGEQYGLAITFVSLVTDTQWDVLESINIAAKIDLSKHKFNLKQATRDAYKLLSLLFITIGIMFGCLYHFYELDLPITLAFLGFEILDFTLCIPYYLRTCFLQLNWSASKTALNKLIARTMRLACAFLPTPFCNNIGAIVSTCCQSFATKFFLHRHFYLNQTGHLRKRPTRRRKAIANYQYDDITIDE